MGQIRVVLIFNEDNERQKEIGEYLKSQKRCKTALITELVYAWLHKENGAVSSYNNPIMLHTSGRVRQIPAQVLPWYIQTACCCSKAPSSPRCL